MYKIFIGRHVSIAIIVFGLLIGAGIVVGNLAQHVQAQGIDSSGNTIGVGGGTGGVGSNSGVEGGEYACGNTGGQNEGSGDPTNTNTSGGLLPQLCSDGSLQPSHEQCTEFSCVTVYDSCPTIILPTTCTDISAQTTLACNAGETGSGRTYQSTANTCIPGVWSAWVLVTNNCTLTTPPATDLCPNLAGTQDTIPSGMVLDTSGNCVTPTPSNSSGDLCPNIAGTQDTIPSGMTLDGFGNCVTPTDVCPNIEGNQATVPSGKEIDGSGNCVTSPTFSLAATPTRVRKDETTTLNWSASDVASCTLKDQIGVTIDSATGPTISSRSVSPVVPVQSTYVLSCTKVGGGTVATTTTVTLVPVFIEI